MKKQRVTECPHFPLRPRWFESQEINISPSRSAIVKAGCLLHTGSHILRLGPRSRTIEQAETREQEIRKWNHPAWDGKRRAWGGWGSGNECTTPGIVVVWVTLSSTCPFNSTDLWEVIYCSVICERNWFGLDFEQRREEGGRVQVRNLGPSAACYSSPAAPVISDPTAWRGLAPSRQSVATNCNIFPILTPVFFNVARKGANQHLRTLPARYDLTRNPEQMKRPCTHRERWQNPTLRKTVASSWPSRSQPPDRIS